CGVRGERRKTLRTSVGAISAAGEQAHDGGVDVEVVGLLPAGHDHVRTAKEAYEYAARHLEQRVPVGGGEGEGDEVTPRCRPGPHPDVSDPGWLVEPGNEQLAREGPADRL